MKQKALLPGRWSIGLSPLLLMLLVATGSSPAGELRGVVVDADSGRPLPCRVYLRNSAGQWLFVESADPAGSAVPYFEQWVPMAGSEEQHTTVSAHPFRIDLAPGQYVLTVERGKEYFAERVEFQMDDQPRELTVRMRRWIDMAARGWYSGETHVHRRLGELPNVMLAEDLNVAFPVTFWTTEAEVPPGLEPSPLRRQGPSPFGPREDRGPTPIRVDATHVILPRNTEYEIFSVGGRRHVLGALFVLNHRTPFTRAAPPVKPIAEQAHAEGALLDLDKHSWPWSMMLAPVARVDLFELSNNSVWKTKFGFNSAPRFPPPWADLEHDGPDTLTEWGWLQYGFEMYYALLNCGLTITPSAGTASGVHPTPLGYGRVYVALDGGFDSDRWLRGLKAGRSFVTTGPMLFVQVDGRPPDETLELPARGERVVEVGVESISERPVERIEILVNGRVVDSWRPQRQRTPQGAYAGVEKRRLEISESSWLVVRSIEPQPDGRKRFAHTAPWRILRAGEPVAPQRLQVQYFIDLMDAEIRRNRDVLAPSALAEFEEALAFYRELLPRSK